jgi:hypothetical protein
MFATNHWINRVHEDSPFLMGWGRARRAITRFLALAGLVALSGCATSKQAQLEAVARDWAMVIRASQVIPVYPLTEDLQPGDVFLVQVPVDQQQAVYKKKGFLPLDNHIYRLDPKGYNEFYGHSFLTTSTNLTLPQAWTHPTATNMAPWQPAPRAAFPTYSFSVKHGAGINLAVPVQGVPVGLSLLGSDAASGTIAIRQAATLGVDTLSLYRDLQQWAATHADFLRHYGPKGRQFNYLRVVTRVYAAGQMGINLKDARSYSGGVDAGIPKPVNLLTTQLPSGSSNVHATTVSNYTNGIAALNEMIKVLADKAGQTLPGGSLKVAAASSRSIELSETLQPPLIFGYLGFDVVVYEGGVLGPPIPTHAVLEPAANLRERLGTGPISATYADSLVDNIYDLLCARSAEQGDERAKQVVAALDDLAILVPLTMVEYGKQRGPGFVLTEKDIRVENPPLPSRLRYRDYRAYTGRLATSVAALEWALKQPHFQWKKGNSNPVEVNAGSSERRMLEATLNRIKQALDYARDCPARNAATNEAVGYFQQLMTQ